MRAMVGLSVVVAMLANVALSSGEQTGTLMGLRQLWTGGDTPWTWAPSPDGKQLVIAQLPERLATYDPATRARTPLQGDERESGSVLGLAWGPSPHIVYTWQREEALELRILKDGRGLPVTLWQGPRQPMFPIAAAPDGERVLALIFKTGAADLAVISAKRVRVVRTLANPSHLQYPLTVVPSGDSSRVAVSRIAPNGRRDVIVLFLEDGSARAVVTHAADDYPLAWSGDELVFASDRTGTVDAWRTKLAGESAPVRLLRDLGVGDPRGFTTTGSVFYAKNASVTNAYQVSLDPQTGKAIDSPSLLLDQFVGHHSAPDWSPDGERIVVTVGKPGMPEGFALLLGVESAR